MRTGLDRPNTNEDSSLGNSPLIKIIDNYIRYYAAGTSHTARAKRLDLKHFLIFLTNYRSYSRSSKLQVQDWDFSSVQKFVDERLAAGEAPSTVARRLATIKHMGRTLAEKIAGFTNPAREVRQPRHEAPQPKSISRAEINSIIQKGKSRLTNKPSFVRMRNHVIFCFMLDTGLRADEVRLLRCNQLATDLEWIQNVRTKGRRYRNVYITSAIRGLVKEYLDRREIELKRFYSRLSKAQNKVLPLFISTYDALPGQPDTFLMGTKTLWRAINELSTQTKLHPHLLRHSYALDLLDSSNDIRLVSQALGHSDVRTTMRYTQRMDHEIAGALEKSRKQRK